MNQNTNIKNAAEFRATSDDIFGRIADRYDLLCDLFSFGIHRIWKRKVARTIALENWTNLLDTATGTGDIVLRVLALQSESSNQNIIASDISPQMLEMAKKRLKDSLGSSLKLLLLDAQNLHQIESDSLDCYSMSLGLKICNRNEVLKEARRVLKPGGRIIILEASNIFLPWLHKMYLFYMQLCMPVIGWIATGGDASAYKYLLQGVQEFPTAENLKSELEMLGFKEVGFERLTLGIVAIHTARK